MPLLILIFNFLMLFWQSSRSSSSAGPLVGMTLGFLIFGFVIVLIIGIAIFAYIRRQKRIQAFHQFAVQNGWQPVPNANVNSFQNSNYSLLSSGRSRLVDGLMQKQFGNGQVLVFDYQYTTGGGKSSHTHRQTVVAYYSPHLNLPYFSLYPESFLSFIGEAFGYNDIDFASHPHFSNRYKLSGRDELAIRQTFHPQMLSCFDQLPTVNVDGGGNYIFIYESGRTAPIQNLNWFINERMKFVSLFAR